MNLQKLTRENLGGKSYRCTRSITFTNRGTGVLSKTSMSFLQIDPASHKDRLIDIFQDAERPCDFYISKGSTYKVRNNSTGGGVFNCKALTTLVREKTFNQSGHAVGEVMPNHVSLVICEKPVDDKSKDVFALIRKKV